MRPSQPLLSPLVLRLSLWLGAAALAFGLFVTITHELLEQDVSGVDRTILIAFAHLRTPWLTVMAVDLTALGSITLVGLISGVAFCVLLLMKDRIGSLQLMAACAGAGIVTVATKNIIDRARPDEVPQLVQVSGFSYPSGHALVATALYLTVAILVGRHLQNLVNQMAILAMTAAIIFLVGISRIYLGVHYPSDVASGISLGTAWALLLAGCFSLLRSRTISEKDRRP